GSDAVHRRARRPHGIQHGHRVLRPLLDRRARSAGKRVRDANTTRVEPNEPAERRQTAIEATPMWFVISIDPDVAAIPAGEQVDRTVTEELVADVQIPALGVMDRYDVHERSAYGCGRDRADQRTRAQTAHVSWSDESCAIGEVGSVLRSCTTQFDACWFAASSLAFMPSAVSDAGVSLKCDTHELMRSRMLPVMLSSS